MDKIAKESLKETASVVAALVVGVLVCILIISKLHRNDHEEVCAKFCPGGQISKNYRGSDHCYCPSPDGQLILKKVF